MTDVARRRIPNVLTVPTFVVGLVWAGWVAGGEGVVDALAAAVLLAVPYSILFVAASGGAGDAKLMAALGAGLGLVNGLAALMGVAVAGIVMALVVALGRGQLGQTLGIVQHTVVRFIVSVAAGGRLQEIMPERPKTGGARSMLYGPAILAGVGLAAIGVYLWKQN